MTDMSNILASLHMAVASDLLRRIESGEATPAELSVATKFLKDNGIEATRTTNVTMDTLASTLSGFKINDEEENY